MDTIFKKLLEAVHEFNSNVDKQRHEMRKYKEDLQTLRDEMYDHLTPGHYLRDENRIIISAPEIIIGNVDKSGSCMGGSTVVLRGDAIKLQGVGTAGIVTTQANSIHSIAEDPGPDGKEHGVTPTSNVKILGRNVGIESNSSKGTFGHTGLGMNGGLSLHSDTTLSVDSSLAVVGIKQNLENEIGDLDGQIATLQTDAAAQYTALQVKLGALEVLLNTEDPLHTSQETTFISSVLIDHMSDQIREKGEEFINELTTYLTTVTDLAEKKRTKADYEAQKNALPDAAAFKDNPNGCNVSVNGEFISITNRDGDGKYRTNADSGVTVNAPHVLVKAKGDDNRNIPKSDVNIVSETINLITANVKSDDKNKKADEATFEADGKFNVISKDISLRTIDYKKKGEDPLHMEKLAEDGSIMLGAPNIRIDGSDEEGKVKGEIIANSLLINLYGAEVDKESREFKKAADGSTLMVGVKEMLIGGLDDSIKTEYVQIQSKEIVFNADQKYGVTQKDATVKIQDSSLSVSSKENKIYGKNKINGETDFSAKTTMTSTEAKEVKVSTHLQAPDAEFGKGSGGAKENKSSDKIEVKAVKIENK